MAAFASRPCAGHADHDRVVDLLVTYRAATRVDVYPTVWRLRLLLTSRVWEPMRDTRIWEDAAGHLVAFAMLSRRQRVDTYLVFDCCVHPEHATDDLVYAMLTWAEQRAATIAAKYAAPLTLFVNPLDPKIYPDNNISSFAFVKGINDTGVYNVYFARSLQAVLPAPTLPPGYTLRALQSGEIESYQAVYSFTAVNARHRRELLASDEYSHLVIADPAGALVAYCECSICRLEWQRSDQRIGWIDYIGTRPDQQRQGLGRAIILASLNRLQAWGAHTAQLLTISSNAPAIALYSSAGFIRVEIAETPGYQKQICVA
jgi:ribosomal protein S18 acetylase RimI-like enzyme